MPLDEAIRTMLRSAEAQGQTALSEYQAKKLLNAYGIPVTREALALSPDEAAAIAARLGYPVVMKACSPQLMHKSEGGWVRLNLNDEADVRRTYTQIAGAASDLALEGVLVQEMVPGQRELVMGLSRDPQFGPCVMLGLGGIMTEVFRDTVFRMAPFDDIEARDMIEELASRSMLGEFRGQRPADMETLGRALTAIGRIGLENEGITEMDVNPLIIDPEGRVVAVDALVVLGGHRAEIN